MRVQGNVKAAVGVYGYAGTLGELIVTMMEDCNVVPVFTGQMVKLVHEDGSTNYVPTFKLSMLTARMSNGMVRPMKPTAMHDMYEMGLTRDGELCNPEVHVVFMEVNGVLTMVRFFPEIQGNAVAIFDSQTNSGENIRYLRLFDVTHKDTQFSSFKDRLLSEVTATVRVTISKIGAASTEDIEFEHDHKYNLSVRKK